MTLRSILFSPRNQTSSEIEAHQNSRSKRFPRHIRFSNCVTMTIFIQVKLTCTRTLAPRVQACLESDRATRGRRKRRSGEVVDNINRTAISQIR